MSEVTGGRGDRTISVVIADDDADDVMLIRSALEETGRCDSIDVVGDGEQLLAYLRGEGAYASRSITEPPGLVLLDLNMPRMSGRQALRAIRSDPALTFTPVVVLSTSFVSADLRDAYENGANSYVVKPNDFDELVAALDTAIEYWFMVVSVPVLEPA